MFRIIRTATVRYNAAIPEALMFAAEVAAYLNKHYELGVKFGAEMYGGPKIHWHFDAESLDTLQQINAKLLTDRDYVGMLDRFKEHWLEGSTRDTLVAFPN